MEETINKILKDIKAELTDEFDRNFEREAFFSKPWNPKAPHGLKLSGNLRTSIKSEVTENSVVFTSQLPYAGVHNDGLRAGRGKGFIMPKRQFIGFNDTTDKIIKEIIGDHTNNYEFPIGEKSYW